LKEFIAVCGHVKACAKGIKPVLKVEEKKKQEPKKKEEAPKKPKKEEVDDEDEAAKKKDINPLDALPPSNFDLFNFKTFFVNHKDKGGEGVDKTLE